MISFLNNLSNAIFCKNVTSTVCFVVVKEVLVEIVAAMEVVFTVLLGVNDHGGGDHGGGDGWS